MDDFEDVGRRPLGKVRGWSPKAIFAAKSKGMGFPKEP